jgi:hypothetical protein
LTCVAGLAVLAMASRPAHAGSTDFGWLYGTEVMPERGIELQTWLAEENHLEDGVGRETQWWVAPSIGLTDRLELVLPVQLDHDTGDFDYDGLWSYGAELRYRFVTPDPVDRPAFAPLVRVAVNRIVYAPGAVDAQADLVGSYEAGRVLALVDLGGDAEVSSSQHRLTLLPGAGVSVRFAPGLRVGIETHAELPDSGTSWLVIGPDLAWTFGRLWLSAAYGFGVLHGGTAPKVQWGIAF